MECKNDIWYENVQRLNLKTPHQYNLVTLPNQRFLNHLLSLSVLVFRVCEQDSNFQRGGLDLILFLSTKKHTGY